MAKEGLAAVSKAAQAEYLIRNCFCSASLTLLHSLRGWESTPAQGHVRAAFPRLMLRFILPKSNRNKCQRDRNSLQCPEGPRVALVPGGDTTRPAMLLLQPATGLMKTPNPSPRVSRQAEGSLGSPSSNAAHKPGLFFRHSHILGPTKSSGLLICLPIANFPRICFVQGK